MNLDRNLQRTLLEELRRAYPEIVDLSQLELSKSQDFQGNIFYLVGHELVEPKAMRHDIMGAPSEVFTARITARGLDFLENDGGLSAVLGTVTVKIEAESLRALVERKLNAADLPAEQKAEAIRMLRNVGGKLFEKLIWKAVDKFLERPDLIPQIIGSLGVGK